MLFRSPRLVKQWPCARFRAAAARPRWLRGVYGSDDTTACFQGIYGGENQKPSHEIRKAVGLYLTLFLFGLTLRAHGQREAWGHSVWL